MQYSDKDIASIAGIAGVRDVDKRAIAVAVALAESGGNTTATNSNSDGSTDTGLWQINSVHQRTHSGWTVAWLKDPMNNAVAMAEVSGGGSNWSPWVAYKNGKYRQFLDRGKTAAEAATGLSITDRLGDIIGGVANPVETAGGIVDAFGNIITSPLEAITAIVQPALAAATWLGNPANWLRIIQVIGGVALGLVAASIVVKPVVEDVGTTIAKKGLP